MLNELFLALPNTGSLAYLIYLGAEENKNSVFLTCDNKSYTYQYVDLLSDNIAVFLRSHLYHVNFDLFIEAKLTFETTVVSIAAIKAGIVIIYSNDKLPFSETSSDGRKPIMTFEDMTFENDYEIISFWQAVHWGVKMPFFNIPYIDGNSIAIVIKKINVQNGDLYLTHDAAIKMVFDAAHGKDLHPVLRLLYRWLKGDKITLDLI